MPYPGTMQERFLLPQAIGQHEWLWVPCTRAFAENKGAIFLRSRARKCQGAHALRIFFGLRRVYNEGGKEGIQ